MVQLIVDELTNKIIGYNTIIPSDLTDVILIEDEQAKALYGLSPNANLYYIDGEIVEQEEDEYTKEFRSIENEYSQVNETTKDEYKAFIDNIMNGMDIKKAREEINKNREKLNLVKNKRTEFNKRYDTEKAKKIKEKFKTEENNIEYKYYLVMLAIIRDENEYLVEWINWYINLGFEHFYIYDNGSEVPIQTYLESINFEHMDKLTIMDWETSRNSQEDAYNDFLNKYRNESKWLMTTDPDELLLIKDNSKTLVEFLKDNEEYSSIKALWKTYSANGHETKSDEPQFERFTTEVEYMENDGKVIAQTNRILKFRGYTPSLRKNSIGMDPYDEIRKSYFQLNHYVTRSYEEWLEKMERGTVLSFSRRNYQDFFVINPDMEHLNSGENYSQEYGMSDTEKAEKEAHKVAEKVKREEAKKKPGDKKEDPINKEV